MEKNKHEVNEITGLRYLYYTTFKISFEDLIKKNIEEKHQIVEIR